MGTRYYHFYEFQGTLAVNRFSRGDMLRINLLVVCAYVFLVALFALILPSVLLAVYVLWMWYTDGTAGHDGKAIRERLIVNALTLLAVIYYLVDFHLGWLSYRVMGSVISKESLDAVASYNMVIGLLSTLFFFVGHELYRLGENRLVRFVLLVVAVTLGIKLLMPITDYLVTIEMLSQSTVEIVGREL